MAEHGKASEVQPASGIERFDLDADVVVVGLGCAGACAAIEASDAGAEVIVLERASGGGGTTAQSGGILYLGGGTPVQKACGFEDSADEMYVFLMAACGPAADAEKVRLFCDESVDHFHWLEGLGVPRGVLERLDQVVGAGEPEQLGQDVGVSAAFATRISSTLTPLCWAIDHSESESSATHTSVRSNSS